MWRIKHLFILTAIILSMISCASVNTPKKWTEYNRTPEETMKEALNNTEKYNLKYKETSDKKTIDAPYKPIISPPEILPVLIYDHITPDGTMVSQHWIFIKLRSSKWYIEQVRESGDIEGYKLKVPKYRIEGETK